MGELELQLRAYGSVLDGAETALTDTVDALPRRMRRSYIVAIAAAIVVALVASAIVVRTTRSSDGRTPRIVTPTPTSVPQPTTAGVLAIGDSVMLGAKSALAVAIPGITVDAVLSRQFADAERVISVYEKAGILPRTIVVALGTNGPTTAAQLDAIMRAAGKRAVFFVTVRVPRTWEATNNSLLRGLHARWPNASVIDWNALSSDHRDWLTADGFHLTAAGQQIYASMIDASLRFLSNDSIPSSVDIVDVIAKPDMPPYPLAVARGAVWVASRSGGGVHLDEWPDPTAPSTRRISVPQESVFAIAGDGESLWVTGGGDGAVPDTTVSRVDVGTGKVVFTKKLTGTPCACPIVAGPAGVWLVGNSSDHALHLSETDGHVIASVPLGARVLGQSAIEVASRLVVGLDDGSIKVIDPTTNRVEHSISRPLVDPEPIEAIVAMTPAAGVATISSTAPVDAFAVRTNGATSAVSASDWHRHEVDAVDFGPASVVSTGTALVALGSDRLALSSARSSGWSEFAYDAAKRRFEHVSDNPPTSAPGFGAAIVAGADIWAVYDPQNGHDTPAIVIARIPATVP